MYMMPKCLDFPSYSLELKEFRKDCEYKINCFQGVGDIFIDAKPWTAFLVLLRALVALREDG